MLRTRQKPLPSLPDDIPCKARPCNHEPDRLYKRKFPLRVLFALRPFMPRYNVAWTSGGIAGLVGKVELAFRFSPLLGTFASKIIGES